MVEKIWVCTIKCGYVPQNIPYDEQPRTCPKCGSPCKESDFIPAGHFGADTKAIMEDYKREGRVLEPVNPDEKGREDQINGMTQSFEIFDSFFNYQVQMMYAGIEATNKTNKTLHLCALALSAYTEVMGGLVTGKLKEKNQSRKNYEAFLPYLGEKYVSLNNLLIEKGISVYEIVRSKLVHEFSPRPSYGILRSEIPNEQVIGIEYLNGHINIRLSEYYRDFKKGVEKYYQELKNWRNNQEKLANFLNAAVERT